MKIKDRFRDASDADDIIIAAIMLLPMIKSCSSWTSQRAAEFSNILLQSSEGNNGTARKNKFLTPKSTGLIITSLIDFFRLWLST